MNRMKELRKEYGLSMMEVAKRLGMPYTTYVNYEKGHREPNSETLIQIADFFHVTVDYLIGNVNDPFFYLDNARILREINSYTEEHEEAPVTPALLTKLKAITDAYNQLNDEGQEKLADYADDLVRSGKYKKTRCD